IPGFPGCGLVMPDIFTAVRFDRDDGRQEEIVATFRAAGLGTPGRAVADADVKQVGCRIVDKGLPHRTAATDRPPFPRPGCGRHAQCLILTTQFRVTWYRMETPVQLAGFRIIGAEVAAHAEFGTGIADQHPAFYNPGRSGNGITVIL